MNGFELGSGIESDSVQSMDEPLIEKRRVNEAVPFQLRQKVSWSSASSLSSGDFEQKRNRLTGRSSNERIVIW